MGLLGKQIVHIDRPHLIQELTRIYADEWFAHYNYQFVSNTLRGHHSLSVIALLHRKSKEAFDRTNRLAGRILELGGEPVSKLSDLGDYATDKPFKLPRSITQVELVLKAVLDAERTSLRSYEALYAYVRGKDLVTERLVSEYLTAVVSGEEELERYLGDAAPQMKGH